MMAHNTIAIGNRRVGPGERCYIIAEIGINHNGQIELAKQLVKIAADAGADAVKFQKRFLPELYSQQILSRPEKGEQGLQYILPILRECELRNEDFFDLKEYCNQLRVELLCTAFDLASVDFLEQLGVHAYKVSSADMTNVPLLERIAQTGKPVLVSTGMSTEEEIRAAIDFLNNKQVSYALLHCVSCYPAPADEINLNVMRKLMEWSGRPVGYSGHETGIAISVAAVGMGACILERHLTLSRNMRGPDHAASLEPAEFHELVRAVREVDMALGSGHRYVTQGELANRRTLGKSLVAAQDIPAGTEITREMIVSKSPGLGLSPQKIELLIGRKLPRALKKGEPFNESDIADKNETQPLARKLDIGWPWGVIVRFSDMEDLIRRFSDAGLSTLELHLTDRDLDTGISAFDKKTYPFDLCIHAPEYMHDYLIDLCSLDDVQYQQSIQRIQKAINLARSLSRYFTRLGPKGPKVVFHVGGMSRQSGSYNLDAAVNRLLEAVKQIDHEDVDLLLENLPPFPWYFGGRWCGHVLTDAKTTAQVCAATDLGLCFDTSHAVLQCNHDGEALVQFADQVRPYVRHIHFSDGAGISGEGLQIGEGQINFVELFPVLMKCNADAVPEIWMGHHQNGRGFQTALERLQEIAWAVRALATVPALGKRAHLQDMVVRPETEIVETLRAIDRNQMGVIFVVDDTGKMIGLATDGDIRRGLLRGVSLWSPIRGVMNSDFIYAYHSTPIKDVRAQLSAQLRVIPILNAAHQLVDFVAWFTPPAAS